MGQQLKKDSLVWFRNEQADENDQDNSNKPFYTVSIHSYLFQYTIDIYPLIY